VETSFNLGGFSRYQIWLSFVLIFPQFAFSWVVLSPIFTGTSHVPIYCGRESYITEEEGSSTCNVNCTLDPNGDAVYSSIVQEVI
jgi:hypothetical protein